MLRQSQQCECMGEAMDLCKSYSEMLKFRTFEERFQYLKLSGVVGEQTFGGSRQLNQTLYRSPEWKEFRRQIIIRDNGFDLGCEDHLINGKVYIHHINPLDINDLVYRRSCIFDPENVISVAYDTHQAIHYGDENLLHLDYVPRKPNDTCPWR